MANTIGLQAIIDVSQFNQGLRLYINGMLDMTKATTQASTQINRLGVAASAGLGAALGTTAVNAVGSLIRGLGSLAAAVGENASQFEGLAIALNFFAARALQETTNLPLAQALAATQVEARGLMLWVERLATLSPFTAEQVGNAFRTAQAYGLSLAAAQKLVPLLIDFAAVNRLSPELLQRVALAMAQIQARGKLASQEINQLANAGLPIRSLLVKALNVTAGELEKMLEEGLIPAGTAIQAVTDYLEGFEGAAEKVTRGTLQGIVSSLQDIRDISSRDLFGPMISSFFPILNQLIDIGNSTEFKAGIKVLGQALGEGLAARIKLGVSQVLILVNVLKQIPAPVLQATAIFAGFAIVLTGFTAAVGLLAAAIGLLINPFTVVIAAIAGFITAYSTNFRGLRDITTNVATAVSNALGTMGRNATTIISSIVTVIGRATTAIGDFSNSVLQYGIAVVETFSAGMMSAMGTLVDTMQFIGSILEFWLAPGSPPRVAPELDTWGSQSANEWLKGWLKADFDILTGISNDIGAVLGALVSAEKLDELAAPRILRALRTELSGAIGEFRKFGKVSEDTLNRVARSAGPAADQVRALFRDYVALAAETEIVRQAQQKLLEITEKYSAILDPIRKKLSDISELRQRADEQKEILSLQRLLANSGVSNARKTQAQLRIQEILTGRQVRGIEAQQKAEETTVEAELKAAQKRKDVAEEQLGRTKALIEIQNEQLNLYGQELQILEKIRKEQERAAKEARDKMLEQLRKQLEIAQLLQAELRDTIGVFKAQHTLADDTATAAEKAAASLELQAILGRRIVRNFEAAELGIHPSEIEKIRNTLVTLEDIGIKNKGNPFEEYSFGAESAIEDTRALVKEMEIAMERMRGIFRQAKTDVDTFLTSIDDMLPSFLKFRKPLNAADKSLSDHIRTQRAATEEYREWPPLFKTLATAFAGIASGIATSRLLTTLPKLLVGLTGPVGIITAVISTLASAWVGNWFSIREKTDEAIKSISASITSFLQSEQWEQFAQDSSAAMLGLITTVTSFADTVKDVFLYIIRPVLAQGFSLKSMQQSLVRLRDFVIVLFSGVTGTIDEEARTAAQAIGTNIRNFLEAYWNPFLAALILSSRQIVTIFSTIFQEIVKQFSFLPRLISFTVRTILTLFGIGLKQLAPLVGKALAPVNTLILNQLGKLGHLLAAVIVSPLKLIGKAINIAELVAGIINQFTTGFAAQLIRKGPSLWRGLLVGLETVGTLLDKTMIAIFSGAAKTITTVFRAPLTIFDALSKLSFTGFANIANLGRTIPGQISAMVAAIRSFGTVSATAFSAVGKRLFDLVFAVERVETAIFNFFQSGNRLRNFMALLPNVFTSVQTGFLNLGTAVTRVADAFDKNLLTVFTSAGKQSLTFLGVITKLGNAIGGKFVTVFQQFKGVGPSIGAAFSGLSQGLRELSLLGTIKVLEFFDGLSRGILSFAGKGQAKLGNALAGIFQGAFKGITTGITGAPNFIGTFLKNLNLASVGKAARIKGPVVLKEFFSTLAQFKPGNIVKGLGSIFGSVKKISGAFGGLLNPINLIISAIDFFGFAATNNIDGVENRAQGFINSLKQSWADLISGKIWQDISDKAGAAVSFMTELWTEFQTNGINSPRIREMLTELGQNILTWITTTGGEILTGLREFWLPMFGIWIRETIENLGTTLGQVAIFIRDWIVIAGTWLGARIAESWTFFWTWWNDQGGAQKTGEWLNGIVDLVVGWITTSATFIYDNFVANWLPAFVNWLTEGGGLSMILTKLGEFLVGIGTWIVTVAAPWLIQKLLTWATAFLEWLGPAAAGAIVGLGKLLGAMIQWIIGTGVPMLVGGVVGLVKALVGWISGAEGSAEQLAPTELGKFLKAILDFFTVHILPAIVTAGGEILKGLWQGFVDMSTLITATETGKAIEDFLIAVQQKITDVRQAGLDFCKNFIDGITSGFTTYVTEPYDAFKTWLLGLVGTGGDAVEAKSPSELTKRLIGTPMAEGIIEGIQAMSDQPVFKTLRDFAVRGLAAFNRDTTGEIDEFSEGSGTIFSDLYEFITGATTQFTEAGTKLYTAFSEGVQIILNDLATKSLLAWQTIHTQAVSESTTMTLAILTDIGTFQTSLTTAMTTIKTTVVGTFTTIGSESLTAITTLTTKILNALVGQGSTGQVSLATTLKTAMEKAGKTIGQAFITGMAFVFTDQESLNPLWVAVDSMVNALVLRLQTALQISSPSKVAANQVGKPIAEGIGLGMVNQLDSVSRMISREVANSLFANNVSSPFNSRLGTFMPSNVTNISRNNTYMLNVNSNASSQGLIGDFSILQTLAGT